MADKEKDVESKLVTDEQATLEAAVRALDEAKSLPEDMRDRVNRLLEKPHEFTEMEKALMNNLKSRFEFHPERHKGVEWAEVGRALVKHPEKLATLQKMAVAIDKLSDESLHRIGERMAKLALYLAGK